MKIIITYENYKFEDLELDRFSEIIHKSNLTLNSDGTYDYYGSLFFNGEKLNSLLEIPIRFKNVRGAFECNYNNLINLEGSPEFVGGDFECYHNNLITLKGAPKIVGDEFDCSYNRLISLQYEPKEIKSTFFCWNNCLLSNSHKSKIGGRFANNDNPVKDFFEHNINFESIMDCAVNSIKQMTHDQLMAELDFFEENDEKAFEIMTKILIDQRIEFGSDYRKKIIKKLKDNENFKSVGF